METTNPIPDTLTPIAARPAQKAYSGREGDYLDIGHRATMATANATFALSFTTGRLGGEQALISKDGRGDQTGDFTLWIDGGVVKLSIFGPEGMTWFQVPGLVLRPDTAYHVALSLGQDGLAIWLDGALVGARPEVKVGLEDNSHAIVVGGSRAWRDPDDLPATPFRGEIGDVYMFAHQITAQEAMALTANANPELGAQARYTQALADLLPAFGQMHHGSDLLKDLAAEYGLGAMSGHGGPQGMGPQSGHGATGVPRELVMVDGTQGADTLVGTDADEGIHGKGGDDSLRGEGGDNVLQGGYGNDTLSGRAGDDILDGGHGEDRLMGGGGDDLLISRSDAREPKIADVPDRDEGDPYNELTDGKLYPDQPIPADDILIGGEGADTFYFQTLINAKARYIEEHTGRDGAINWHGVAGENDKLHDHWVDHIGHDVILDFSRAEGDTIVIEGHTTEIRALRYRDQNGDGVMDATVIELYSNQGRNGGAHQYDELGTITVFGDLLQRSDILDDAGPAYGIVDGIHGLDEAVAPAAVSTDTGRIFAPLDRLGAPEPGPLARAPALALPGTHRLGGTEGDYLDVGDHAAIKTKNATVSLAFASSYLPGEQAILSMDGRDNQSGDFTIWANYGQLVVRLQDGEDTKWLEVPDIVLTPGQTYHLAVSVGQDGLMIWLDGVHVAAEPEMKVGFDMNERALVVGASRAWRDDQTDEAHSPFAGMIKDVAIYDRQLNTDQVIRLAAHSDAEIGAQAIARAAQDALAPTFTQMHHASDTLKTLAMEYGLGPGHVEIGGQHGMPGVFYDYVPRPLEMIQGTPKGDRLKGTSADEGIDGQGGNDRIRGEGGDNVLQGGYGNDRLWGKGGRDVLDGGHGEDRLFGGGGDDLLISRSDAREPTIGHVPDRDEADPYGELTEGKLYPNQPIAGDDLLVGGGGADIFYFQTLINAKARYLEKHTQDDGTIRWHGVAGENDKLHDHWVDHLGHDVIRDYDRDEGDRIVIEGHTTDIESLTYGDANRDGIYDHTVITLQSDQGSNGGAHHLDPLGTITVYGDLVRWSDITHTDAPAYGIVDRIDDLDEAVAPAGVSKDLATFKARAKDLPARDAAHLPDGSAPVAAIVDAAPFSRDDRDVILLPHRPALALDAATIAMGFTKDSDDWMALFSKDHADYGNGGHVTAWVDEGGTLTLRIQSTEESHYLKAEGLIETGTHYDLAVTMGGRGAEMWVNGVRVAYDETLTTDLSANTQAIAVGASIWNATAGTTDKIHSHFSGEITGFAVYEGQKTGAALGHEPAAETRLTLPGRAEDYGIAPSGEGFVFSGPDQRLSSDGDTEWLVFHNVALRSADVQIGNGDNETLDGGDGADLMLGAGGDDKLYGRRNDDVLKGDAGHDGLWGQDGRDTLLGGDGDDYLDGGEAGDRLEGGHGDDELKGGAGNDVFLGGFGDDMIMGHSWGEAGRDGRDTAVYDGNRSDYTFRTETFFHGGRDTEVVRLVITDTPSGGLDGYYEGEDRLMDIDFVTFADGTVPFADLL